MRHKNIIPCVSLKRLAVWESFYFRHNSVFRVVESTSKEVRRIHQHLEELKLLVLSGTLTGDQAHDADLLRRFEEKLFSGGRELVFHSILTSGLTFLVCCKG